MAIQIMTAGNRHFRLPASPLKLGVYVGNGNSSGTTTDVATFATDTGTSVNIIQTYLPHTLGWVELTSLSNLTSWMSHWAGVSQQMMIAVPMVCSLSGTAQNTLAQGAAGNENSIFTSFAQNLVSLGYGNAVLRLGWEQNIGSNLWGVNSNADATNYATYWQQTVTTMRAVSGANFKFMWSVARIQDDPAVWEIDYTQSYPGDPYVDYIGMDVYDTSNNVHIFSGGVTNNTCTVAQSNQVWNEILTGNSFGGTPSNLLATEDSVFENGGVGTYGHWVGTGSGGSNCTLASVSGGPLSDAYSMQATAQASGYTNPRMKFLDGVQSGGTYTFTLYVKTAVTPRSWSVTVPWYDFGGNLLATSSPVTTATDNTSTWTELSVTVTAPTNPLLATCSFAPSFNSGGANEVHFVGHCTVAGPMGSQGSLNWLAEFAQLHQKSLTIPEWAVLTQSTSPEGLGDDPTFIQNMHQWLVANNAAISCYFSQVAITATDYNLIDGNFPNSLTEFEGIFG